MNNLMDNLNESTLDECPVCGSDSLDTSTWDSDSEFVWRKCYCMGCGYQWQEVFMFYQNENLQGERLTATEIEEERGN